MPAYTVSTNAAHPENWRLAADAGLWATPVGGGKVRAGDEFFLWRSPRKGWVAHFRALEDAREVSDASRLPWPDRQRYRHVFRIEVLAERDLDPVVMTGTEAAQVAGLKGTRSLSSVAAVPSVAEERMRELLHGSATGLRGADLERVEGDRDASLWSEADARQFVRASIVRRQGQPAFRGRLLRAYGGRCAVTDCDAAPALEAAHITPYLGLHTNEVTNGLLLRADIHTLFDLYLLTVRADTRKVQLSRELRSTGYARLQGRPMRAPRRPTDQPSEEHLRRHNDSFFDTGK